RVVLSPTFLSVTCAPGVAPTATILSPTDGTEFAYGEAVSLTLLLLDSDETLVVVTSKTFSTQETLLNAATTRAWLDSAVGAEAARHHMLAITSDALRATDMGFFPHNIYTFPASVGGRFCLWSCAGFAIAAGCGVADYRQLLAGASAMDAHFLSAPLLHNMPMMMAALGCWYRNGWGLHAQGALPYAERLRLLPAWLQQLEMESNGKSASTLSPVPATAPLLFGGTGTCMQHSFGQWLHQGSDIVPVDFIGVLVDDRQSPEHHRVLFAHLLAQSQGLMKGRSVAELQRAGVDAALHQHKFMPGNRPSSILLLSRLDAYHLGALLALYEHKTYVQSVLWGLNAFDQWGVELGKELQTPLLAALSGGAVPEGLDASTHANLNLFLKK
ncbi:MAG: glucose-6-phosphate isomerase, partial [Alphaproteobacteria bacterium]|nr:glucose-6-phosphate isomerase [Alphaproteobacteria bacterium]